MTHLDTDARDSCVRRWEAAVAMLDAWELRGRCCVIGKTGAVDCCVGVVQMVSASSVKATEIRWLGWRSTASS